MRSPVENLLSRLEGVVRGRENNSARCPAHEDQHASLSIREAASGSVLVKCHAGCSYSEIMAAVGLSAMDGFPKTNGSASGPFTLEELSRQRRLPVDFLRSLGLTSSGSCIRVPYFQADGKQARPQLRWPGGEQKWGRPDSLPIIPYGLSRLDSDEAALAEGSSDCWTLWHVGFPAVGIPGASMHRKLEAEHIRRLRRIYIVREADDGGATFETNIRAKLNTLGFRGEVLTVDMAGLGAKDPSALFLQDPDGFAGVWRQALEGARDEVLDEEPFVLPGVLVSDVEREKVRWLWPGRLALGKLTIVDGDPGVGKSTLYLDLAARITRGGTWPDGTPIHEPGNVVIVTVEDAIADTIRPRLEEAGADVSRVLVIQLIPEADGPGRVPSLPEDTELIMKTAAAFGARLVVIDPLFAHLGAETNSYRDQDVRRALAPLSEAAERADVAVLVIRHLNKSGGGRALYRGGGSIGIIGAARIGLLVGEDPDSEGVCVLASTKNNLAARPDSLAFRVVSSENDSDVAVIHWEGTSALTADELCRAPAGPSKIDDAECWLEKYLVFGPKPSADIFERGEEKGYSKNTLYRAKENLDIEAKKLDFDGGWEWRLPTLPEGRFSQDEPKVLISKVEHLRGSSAGGDGADSSNLTELSLFNDSSDPWDNAPTSGVEVEG